MKLKNFVVFIALLFSVFTGKGFSQAGTTNYPTLSAYGPPTIQLCNHNNQGQIYNDSNTGIQYYCSAQSNTWQPGPFGTGTVNPSSTALPLAQYKVPGEAVSPTPTLTFDFALNQLNSPNTVSKLPRVDVRSPDFGNGSPIKNLTLSGNTGCTANTTITAVISAPHFSTGVPAIANLGCGTNGQIYLNPMNNEGSGYDSSVTITVSGLGVSGAIATPILDTPGVADPSGTSCSSSAVQSALDYAISLGLTTQVYPTVYIPGAPSGKYLLCKTLDSPSGVMITGDASASTNLQVQGNFPALYVYLPTVGFGGPTAGSDIGLGGLRDLTLTGTGTSHTVPLLLVRQGRGLVIDNIHFAQTAGIGLKMAAGERDLVSNLFFNNVRWCEADSGQNETKHVNVNCQNPGQVQNVGSGTAFCYEVNCINGVGIAGWGGGTLTAAVTDGNGGAYFTINKAASPIVRGQTFQVAGITDLTALNGTWTATNVGVPDASVPFAQVTSFSITGSVATVQASNAFFATELVTFANMTVGTYFNNAQFTVLSASSTQFTVAIAHANVASTPDTGQALTLGLNNCLVPSSPYDATAVCLTRPTSPTTSFVVIAKLVSGTFIQGPDYGNAILCSGSPYMPPCSAPTAATPAAGASSGLGSATWKPSSFPHYNPALFDYGGSMTTWDRSSVKSLVHAACFQSNNLSPTMLSAFYCEDAVPGSAGPGIMSGGDFPYTYTTTEINTTNCPFTPSSTAHCLVSAQSFQNFYGQGWYPYQMDEANAGQEVAVACADYNPTSSAPCPSNPLVNENQIEVMVIYYSQYSGSNVGYIGARNFVGTSSGLSTNTVWPIGSLMGTINFKGTSGGGFLQMFKNHVNSNVTSDSPTGVYSTNSADNSFFPSGTYLVSGVPDGVTNFLPPTSGQAAFSASLQLSDSSTDLLQCTVASEAFGYGCVKVLGSGSVFLYGNSNPVSAALESSTDIANCQSYTGQSEPVIFAQYAGGVNSSGNLVDSDTNTIMSHATIGATPCIFTQRFVRGQTHPVTGFSNSYSFVDLPATGSTTPFQVNLNGVLSGNPGLSIITNNGTANSNAFMINLNIAAATGTLSGYALNIANTQTLGFLAGSTLRLSSGSTLTLLSGATFQTAFTASRCLATNASSMVTVSSGNCLTGPATTTTNGLAYFNNTVGNLAEISPNITTTPCYFQQVGNGSAANVATCGTLPLNVASLNSLTGALTIAAGSGITVTPSGGNTLTIAATSVVVPLLYNNAGTSQTGYHFVGGRATLVAGTATVTLSGSAAYTSSASYNCSANDTTGITTAVQITYGSGTAFTFTGTGTDGVTYHCVGN